MARHGKGDRVFLKGGRHRGATGRVVRTEDVTTSSYDVDIRRRKPVRALRTQMEAAPEPKKKFLDSWMPW